MATLIWNDVKVLNPTTGLYEAYITREKIYTPGTTVFCTNGEGWYQAGFIGPVSFDSGKMLDGIIPLHGQYIRYIDAQGTIWNPLEVIKVIDENEFNNGQMQTPNTYYPPNVTSNTLYPNAHIVDYSALGMVDYVTYTVDFITYCCKKATSYSPVTLSMVCVGGCTDPLALNYDQTQLIDDGSCTYNGCMDTGATNYNSQAIYDDGSCVYDGCTDPQASNYSPIATIDDGSCQCIKCCEEMDVLGNITHILLSTSTTPCQCPSGTYTIPCGEYSGWDCNPLVGSCSLTIGGAYSSQTECDLDCRDCGCTKLLGTGHTDAYAITLSEDCEEYCCDPDLLKCSILVVGDDEGIQVYDPITNNTSHLFDSNFADVLDIASTRSGNNGFIWVYKSSIGAGVTFLEYAITMVPFTQTLLRTITFTNYVVGRGLTYFGHNASGEVLLTAGAGTGSIQNYVIPIGVVNVTVAGTATFAYALPTGYSVTGDLITEGSSYTNPLDCVLYNNGSTHKVGIISRNTGTVLDEHTISTAILTGTTRMEGLFVITSPLPGRIMGVTTDGRIYELLQNAGGGLTAGLQFAPTQSGQIDFINNVTKKIYGADNISGHNELCTRKIIQMPDSFDCVVNMGGCWDPGTGLGQYSTLADCQASCIVTWDCNPGSTAGNCKAVKITINNYFVDRERHALQWISVLATGMQAMNFNTISWPNVMNPTSTIPGVCWMKWGYGAQMTLQQKWKIRRISCKQIHPTAYFYTWKQFVTYAALSTGNGGLFNTTCTYDIAQAWLYQTYGFMPTNQIKIYSEPCICWSHKCGCSPLLGPSGQHPSEIACLSLPCCPCKKCCRKTTPPYNTISLSPTQYPCKCPQGYTPAICLVPEWPDGPSQAKNDLTHIEYLPKEVSKCEKTCTNSSYYIPLEIDDEHCDCETYGLDEAPPKCNLCCTDGTQTKKLALYSTICECETGWYECETTPDCDKLCVSTSKKTTKQLLKPEWPNCGCPVGYKVYVDETLNTTTVTSSDGISCSKCSGGEAVTRTFGGGICPDSWTVSVSFNVGSCGRVEPPTIKPSTPIEVKKVEITEVVSEDVNTTGYICSTSINELVGEKQQSCVPSEKGTFKTIEACLDSGCAGYMSCAEGVAVDGVKFYGKTYTPIVMCCESVIKESKEKLTKDQCLQACKGSKSYGKEPWYPLYNAFGPNTIHDSLLSYMLRELLEPVKNGECRVGEESTFTALGYKKQ